MYALLAVNLPKGFFVIDGLGAFDFCGISGGSVNTNGHIRIYTAALRNTRPWGDH